MKHLPCLTSVCGVEKRGGKGERGRERKVFPKAPVSSADGCKENSPTLPPLSHGRTGSQRKREEGKAAGSSRKEAGIGNGCPALPAAGWRGGTRRAPLLRVCFTQRSPQVQSHLRLAAERAEKSRQGAL